MLKKNIVIIGGGLGGLITGVILQKNNYDVTIVEKNSRVGGLLQSFKRKGCVFDTGMHYIGSLDKGQVMYKIFNYLNILDKLDLQRMDADGYDVFKIADKEYKLPFGWDNFAKQMLYYFPDEEKAISNYIDTVKEVADSHDLYNLRFPIKMDLSSTTSLEQGVNDFVTSITTNIDLQNVFLTLNSIYAGKKDTSSLYMHSVIHNYYNNSAYKIKGGGEKISIALENEFKNIGGKVFVNEEILKFNFKDKILESVTSKTNNIFNADYFISNMHPSLTVKLIDNDVVRKSYKNRMLGLKNTISTFGIHVKLKDEIFPNMNYNFHRYLKNDIWGVDNYDEKTWPQEYLIYTPIVKSELNKVKCFSIYTYMKYEEVEKWSESDFKNRPQEYKDWKQQKSKELLDVVGKDFPEIEGNIDYVEVLSPLSYKDYVNNVEGEMYGIVHDFNNAIHSHIFPSTKVKNLFLTGQNVNMHGMLGVALGSMLTSNEFISLNQIVEEINSI